MANQNQEPCVLISGGGPAGLLSAILLNNIGVSSIVVERAKESDEWSSKSYTLVLGEKGKSSLERGGCLESASAAGIERKFVYMFDGMTGNVKKIPKANTGIGFTRPLLVECLEQEALSKCPKITLMRGAGVASVSIKEEGGLEIRLEDGSTISSTHVIGADGKWSIVRQSTPSLNAQAKMITSPSFGVSMNSPTIPEGLSMDGTHVINPPRDCMFYIIVSGRPKGDGVSLSMVCYDQTVEKYPWLAPDDMPPSEDGRGWENEYSALPKGMSAKNELSQYLQDLFKETVPEFYKLLDNEVFTTARINRRVTYIKMTAAEGKDISYSTGDGCIALIGDAAHAMTPSMGEGANTAMESAVKLVDSVSDVMKQKGESICSTSTLGEGFIQYGLARPTECIPIVEASAARNIMKKK